MWTSSPSLDHIGSQLAVMVLRAQWPLGTIAQFFHFVAEGKKKKKKKKTTKNKGILWLGYHRYPSKNIARIATQERILFFLLTFCVVVNACVTFDGFDTCDGRRISRSPNCYQYNRTQGTNHRHLVKVELRFVSLKRRRVRWKKSCHPTPNTGGLKYPFPNEILFREILHNMTA